MNRSEISSRRRCGIIILAVLIAATLAFIWSNSSDSPEDTHEKSDGIVEILKPILDPFDLLIRKAAHFSEYALLGAELFVMRLLLERSSNTAVPLAVLCTAVIDETIQIYSDRTSSTVDVIIDFFGGLAGILFIYICLRIYKCIKHRRRLKIS